jgi:hypothetical protein
LNSDPGKSNEETGIISGEINVKNIKDMPAGLSSTSPKITSKKLTI